MPIIRGDDDIFEGLEALSLADPRLAAVIARAGPLPLRLNEPGFAGLAHIIVSQMVSRASANAIWQRIEAVTGPVTAQGFMDADPDLAAGFGLSRAKADTLTRVAEAVVAGTLDLGGLSRADTSEAMAALTGIRGIGPWTAEVYLMFCGGHPDVFPAGDVALQSAVGHALGFQTRPTARMLIEMAALWSPWRSVAARLFWAYYATEMRRDGIPIP